ncbi:MAG: hypothetical protein ACRERW_18765 [Pseudomonas sp.]
MLILPLHVTHNLLTHTVTAFDVSFTKDVAGRPLVAQGADYSITDANVQPASYKMVQLLPEGAQADGALVMHTRATISIAGNVNGASSGVQTYIRMNGDIWKAWQVQNWKPHSPIGRYLLTRYVNVDGTIT